jgi:hypothetical protein
MAVAIREMIALTIKQYGNLLYSKIMVTALTIIHIFPESGRYKLWDDFKPKDGNQTLVAFMIKVTGQPV